MRPLLATLAAVVLLAGCGGGRPRPADPATGPSAGDSVEDSGEPTARVDRGRAIADAPTSVLRDVRVRRTPRGLDVTAWWGCVDPLACPRSDQAVAASGDDFATATYDQVPRGEALRRLGGADPAAVGGPPGVPATRGLVSAEGDSLVAGVRAVVAGGDGATFLPFQRVVRGTDGRWEVFDVPEIDGERGYVSGAVVLPDGRLLVLLPVWSGDRADRPSAVHHGLWVSASADWSSCRPWAGDPGDVQRLRADPREGGVLWLLVADDVAPLLVSTDGGRTLRAVRAR